MRRNILHLFCIFLLAAALLLCPAISSKGVSLGIHIAIYSLIPAILPFMILSNYIIRSNMSKYISRIIHPVITKIFHTSQEGSYVVFMGFLCGFPLGSKILLDLLKENRLSKEEANLLFRYMNNPSPSFIICYMSSFYFKNIRSKLILLLLIYLPSVIIGFFYARNHSFSDPIHIQPPKSLSFSKNLDDSIFQALMTVSKLAGYIIVFCVCSMYCSVIPFISDFFRALLSCCLEITSGIYRLSQTNICVLLKLYLSSVFSIAGGICIIFQINSVIGMSVLKITDFIKYKLLSVCIFTLLFILYYLPQIIHFL